MYVPPPSEGEGCVSESAYAQALSHVLSLSNSCRIISIVASSGIR